MKWIKDEEFIRGSIPMTKFDIRVLTIATLNIGKEDVFLDIGAGTGSISIEAALQEGKVWAVEKEKQGIQLIKENAKKFKVDINTIEGVAPNCLPSIKINKCFIGGSKGRLEEIFKYLEDNLQKEGIIVGNFITINNLNEFLELLERYSYADIETRLIQTSTMNKLGMLKGNNPIFIAKGVKK